jgi:hypothetical protein
MGGPYIHPLAVELNAFSAICYATIRIKFSFMQFIIFFGGGWGAGWFLCLQGFQESCSTIVTGSYQTSFSEYFYSKIGKIS